MKCTEEIKHLHLGGSQVSPEGLSEMIRFLSIPAISSPEGLSKGSLQRVSPEENPEEEGGRGTCNFNIIIHAIIKRTIFGNGKFNPTARCQGLTIRLQLDSSFH